MRTPTRAFLSWLPLLGLVLVSGCGGSGLASVSGTVTFKGQPLDQGTIQFVPQEKQKTIGFTTIQNGRYEIPGDKGLEPGKYKVVISSGDTKAKVEAVPGESGPPAKERIPQEFNARSNVYKDVTASGPNKFDFTIP